MEPHNDAPAEMPTDGVQQPTDNLTPTMPGMPEAPVPSPAPAVGTIGSPKKKRGMLVGLVAGAAVLVLGGGGAAAYFGYVVPSQPANVLRSAISNVLDVNGPKSGYFTGKVEAKNTASGLDITGNLSGKAKDNGDLQVTADIDAVVTKITLDVRSVDGSLYIKVGGLEGLPELLNASGDPAAAAYAPVIAGLNEQWLQISASLLKEWGANLGASSGNLSDADMQRLADILAKHNLLSVQKTFADETIKGQASHHYRVIVNSTEAIAALTEIKNANLKTLKITQDDLNTAKQLLKDSSKYPVDLWVAKASKEFDQVAFSMDSSGTTVSVTLTLYDYNKPVTVDKPAGAKSLLEVLGTLMGGSSSNPQLLEQLQNNGISL